MSSLKSQSREIAQGDISPICPEFWCYVGDKQQPVMMTGDGSNVLAQFVSVRTRKITETLFPVRLPSFPMLSMHSPIQSGLPQKQAESTGIIFFSYPGE